MRYKYKKIPNTVLHNTFLCNSQVKSINEMKKTFFYILFFTSQYLNAQQLTSSVGNSFKNTDLQVDFALGEIAIATFQQGNTQLSQGMMQPTYQISVTANETFDKAFSLKAFPNPTSGWLQIETDFDAFDNFFVSDSQGKMVFQSQFQYQPIDLSFLPKGIYFLQLNAKKGIFKNIKIEVL